MAMQPDARQTGFPPSTRLQAAGVNFEGKIVGKSLRACPNRLFRFRRCRAGCRDFDTEHLRRAPNRRALPHRTLA
ncbi:hypothetical protein [Burkholderia cenocepacia]|uniref:hypothetical protein n=1 Tax=Burkholderia cenocepacia TaxID=95486 RepID=UPI002DDD08E5|nr:hypothetical protein [Burkholderia cenocepacia]MEC4775280.1 hypothetical protein [Burkholderia cenocepacia]